MKKLAVQSVIISSRMLNAADTVEKVSYNLVTHFHHGSHILKLDMHRALEQGCQTQIHSGPKLNSKMKSQARLNVY